MQALVGNALAVDDLVVDDLVVDGLVIEGLVIEAGRGGGQAASPMSSESPAVELLCWPDAADRRRQLRELGRPCLLLVAEDTLPPIPVETHEDWIRLPAPQDDFRARVETLSSRAEALGKATPHIDDDGVLRFQDKWAPVPPLERRIADVLVSNFGAVVSRERLTEAGWPREQPGRNALDVHVLRLRRRLTRVDLSIRTVRSRGYLLETT